MESLIIEEILEGINSGLYKPGEKLPSENQLSYSFNVPRIVVRRAYSKLEERGYIKSFQGRGRFLSKPKKQVLLDLTGNVSFSEKLKKLGMTLESDPVYKDNVPYDKGIWEKLGLSPGDEVFRLGLLRVVDGEPIAIHNSYVSPKDFPHIESECHGIRSMYSYFKRKGFSNFHSGPTNMTATLPSSQELELLGCPTLVPILVLESTTYSKDRLIQYSQILYRGDIFTYQINL